MAATGVARVNLDKALSLIATGSTTVFLNGSTSQYNAAIEGSIMAGPSNRGDIITSSKVTVFVENKRIAVEGAVTAQGRTVGKSSPNVWAGNSGPAPAGATAINGRLVYGDTPAGISSLKASESLVSPNISTYHEDTPGQASSVTDANGNIMTMSSPADQSINSIAANPLGCVRSKYFTLADSHMPIVAQMGQSQAQLECNWIALCTHILDVIKDSGHKFSINSGFRTLAYNRSIGSSDRSDHTFACAVDISTGSQANNVVLFKHLLNNPMYNYSQLIFEGNWIHIAYNGLGPKGPAKVMFTFTGSSPKIAGATGQFLPSELRVV